MAEGGEPQDDDVLELGQPPEGGEDQQQVDAGEGEGGGEDDLEIPSFTDEADDQEGDTDLVKHLRAELRRVQAEKKEFERSQQPKPKVEVGPKPTLESCEYDEDKFEGELLAWQDRKRQADADVNAGKEAEQKRAQELGEVIQSYATKLQALPYADKDDMQATTLAALSDPQKEIFLRIAADPAKLAYALGRNPAKLAALAKVNVTDMASVAHFGAAVSKLDGELKMAKRKPGVAVSKPIGGGAPVSNSTAAIGDIEKQLDKAAAKGDMKEVRRLRKLRDERKAA